MTRHEHIFTTLLLTLGGLLALATVAGCATAPQLIEGSQTLLPPVPLLPMPPASCQGTAPVGDEELWIEARSQLIFLTGEASWIDYAAGWDGSYPAPRRAGQELLRRLQERLVGGGDVADHLALTELLLRRGETPLASEVMEQAMRQCPGGPGATRVTLLLRAAQGRTDAVAELTDLLDTSPAEAPLLHQDLGDLLLSRGRAREALAHYLAITGRQEADLTLTGWVRAGGAALAAAAALPEGDTEVERRDLLGQARDYYGMALDLCPASPAAARGQAWAQVQLETERATLRRELDLAADRGNAWAQALQHRKLPPSQDAVDVWHLASQLAASRGAERLPAGMTPSPQSGPQVARQP